LDDPDRLISQLQPVQIVFNCLHGGSGEDGTVQLLLELLGISYTGSPPLACALAMDKLAAKKAFQQAGLPTPRWLAYRRGPWAAWSERVAQTIGYPCVVKPVRQGSSFGVWIVSAPEELISACAAVKREYTEFFIETYIPGREITVGILALEGRERALPLLELRPKSGFYDYQAKYSAGLTEFIIPAQLDAQTTQHIQGLSLKAHQALGCQGFSRVDLRVTEEGEAFILEVNTVPGLTSTSDLPQAAQAAGLSFAQLVEAMLLTAQQKK
ncbi:MAG TPA: D-alanine--D-alanine ligase, partial [Candidatus Fraserbacteria bacterium]|nr:D-alanine--D-alanine ligase [Candidatus Fraserbacteria bacterium]